MKSIWMLLTFLSLYRLVILPIVTCVETITVGTDPKTKKTNPYITKFHEEAGSRPTKCQGKHTCFQFIRIIKRTSLKQNYLPGISTLYESALFTVKFQL